VALSDPAFSNPHSILTFKINSFKLKYAYLLLLLFICQFIDGQDILGPDQPISGPGGSEYLHDSIVQYDYAAKPDGFWLYEPALPRPDSAHLVVFVHGYGAYNPVIYGDWIEHLVRKGNIVLFPRFQKNLFSPSAAAFIPNVATAIKDAMAIMMDTTNHVLPIVSQLAFVGHSYGGVISAGLGAAYAENDIPQPKVLMLCSPGSGPLSGGVLEDYSGIPADTKLLVMVSEDDRIVGDKLGLRIFETATKVGDRNLVRQFKDHHGSEQLEAGHNECYSFNAFLDNGVRNITARRAKSTSTKDAVDYFGYWKILDALLDCTRSNTYCNYALGDTPEQRSMGIWSDGKVIKELEITQPEKKVVSKKIN